MPGSFQPSREKPSGTKRHRVGFAVARTETEEIPTMATKTLEDLFHETLKDIYYAERKILKALPKMARGAQDEKLKAAFLQHKEETEGQVERLQQVFEIIGKRPRAKTCPAIDGIVEEGEEIMEEFKGSPALDAGLLAAAQAVEHYEISRYGTLRAWAQQLGYTDAVKLLEETLAEESKTDEALTKLAEKAVNAAAQKKAA
jgi:ferritin-like metal-binding protein YciE